MTTAHLSPPRPSARARLTVAICAHNAAPRIGPTLAALALQRGLPSSHWEILLIDNASGDDTRGAAARAWQAAGGDPAHLRIIPEPQAGLLHARRRALAETRSDLLCFVDDDNALSPDYLARATAFMDAHPQVGALGGSTVAGAGTYPDWFDRYARCYAVGPQHDQAGDVTDTAFPLWGAGIVMRTAALTALECTGFRPVLTGRIGGRAMSGDDTELCFALRRSGWRLWYQPELRLTHNLQPDRLRWGACLKQNEGFGAASPILDLYRHDRADGPRPALKWLAALRRATRHRWIHRRTAPDYQAIVPPATPAACDRAMAAAWAQGRWQSLTHGRTLYLQTVRELRRTPWSHASPPRPQPVSA